MYDDFKRTSKGSTRAGRYPSKRWPMFTGLPGEFSLDDCIRDVKQSGGTDDMAVMSSALQRAQSRLLKISRVAAFGIYAKFFESFLRALRVELAIAGEF